VIRGAGIFGDSDMAMNDIKELESLLSARMPVVIIESHEEQKVTSMLDRFSTLNERTFFTWNVTQGLRRANSSNRSTTPRSCPTRCGTSSFRR